MTHSADGKPNCTESPTRQHPHSWDNEFCVAACVLVTELIDLCTVRAKGKTHRVRSQGVEAGTPGPNYTPSFPRPHQLSPRTDHLSGLRKVWVGRARCSSAHRLFRPTPGFKRKRL